MDTPNIINFYTVAVSVFSSLAGSAVVIFLFKNFITKSIDHGFNKNLEIQKAELAKSNINHQIVQSETIKYKYDKVTSFYSLLIQRKKLNQELLGILSINNLDEMIKKMQPFFRFSEKLRDELLLTKIYLSDDAIKVIEELLIFCSILESSYYSAAECTIKKNELFIALQYDNSKQSEFDEMEKKRVECYKSINDTNKLLQKSFSDVVSALKTQLNPF